MFATSGPRGGPVGYDQTLQAITNQLDSARGLLDVAVQHLTVLERRAFRHEFVINDLHWDAARILTSDDPSSTDTPGGQRALRAVNAGAHELAIEVGRSAAAAGTAHVLLSRTGQELTGVERLLDALRADADDLPAEVVVEVAVLVGRADRLSMLIEVAAPLAERAQAQLTEAHDILEQQIEASDSSSCGHAGAAAVTDVGRFQRFWAVDVGLFDGSRALARACGSTRDGAAMTARAAEVGAVTAVHVRELRHMSSHDLPPPPSGRPPTAGPSI